MLSHPSSLQEWLSELNAFKAASLAEWQLRPTYDVTHTQPGGMSLLAYGHRKGVNDRTVMVMDLMVAGRPAMIDPGAFAIIMCDADIISD